MGLKRSSSSAEARGEGVFLPGVVVFGHHRAVRDLDIRRIDEPPTPQARRLDEVVHASIFLPRPHGGSPFQMRGLAKTL